MNRHRTAFALAVTAASLAACQRSGPPVAPKTQTLAVAPIAGSGLYTDAGAPVDAPIERVGLAGGAGLRPTPGPAGLRP